MNVLDLFSGIGGFSLGLERAGMRTVAFCEINPFCQKVLAKHWPHVACYDDIRTLTAERLAANAATGDIAIDVICGGFPCQDVSLAGARKGLDGERSGLWSDYRRLIGEIRPHFVIVENTPGLLSLGMGTVLGDLAALGYDAEWHSIPASAIGADHIRDRVWIIAYSHGTRLSFNDECWWQPCETQMGKDAANVNGKRKLQSKRGVENQRRRSGNSSEKDVADVDRTRSSWRLPPNTFGQDVGGFGTRIRLAIKSAPDFSREFWDHKPVLGRGLHGVSDRVDRINALGNAVIPQIPEIIGHVIMQAQVH